MCDPKWVIGGRLSLAFLLAPAVAALWLSISMDVVLKHLGWEPSDIANILLGMCWFTDGAVVPYLGTLFFGLPYVLIMLARGWLNFWTVMAPITVLSLVHGAVVYSSLCPFDPSHPFAEAVAGLQVPGTIVAGLCFYLLGVWRLPGWPTPSPNDSHAGGQEGSDKC